MGNNYSKEIGDKICRAIANGRSLRSVCKELGIDKSSVIEWLENAALKEFIEQYVSARQNAENIQGINKAEGDKQSQQLQTKVIIRLQTTKSAKRIKTRLYFYETHKILHKIGKSIAHLFLVVLKLFLLAPAAIVGFFPFIIGIGLWVVSMVIIISWTGSIVAGIIIPLIIFPFIAIYITSHLELTCEMMCKTLFSCLDIDKDEDDNMAVEWWGKLAEQGNSEAQYQLALAYYKGDGVKVDYKEAVKWLSKSAEQGNILAQLHLADIFSDNYFKDYEGLQNYSEAAKWYQQAAKQGDAIAQYKLGYLYYEGKGVAKDYKAAVDWWTKSAEQNYGPAQCDLGINAYYQGKGVPKDYILAYKWLILSSTRGSVAAKWNFESLEKVMTPDQIAEAQRLAREWNKQGQLAGPITLQNAC